MRVVLKAWRDLSSLVAGIPKMVRQMALVSLLASAAEAAVLVLIVNAAFALTQAPAGTPSIALRVPLIGSFTTTAGPVLALAFLGSLTSIAGHVIGARLSARLSATALEQGRLRALNAYSSATWHRQALEREGALQLTVTTLCRQSAMIAFYLSLMITAGVALAALLLVALLVDPRATIAVILGGACLFLLLRPFTNATQRRARSFVSEDSLLAEEVAAWTTMSLELRVFGTAHGALERLRAMSSRAAAAFARSRSSSQLATSLYKDAALMALVGAVAAMAYTGASAMSSMGAVVILMVRSLNYATQVQGSLQSISEMAPNLDALLRRVDELESAAERVGTRAIGNLRSITVDEVTYSYDAGRGGLESGISFTLRHGESLGIIGASGSGKSTLAEVLLRLRPPSSGEIRVNRELNYLDISSESWTRLVAMVPQEPVLVEGTIADNIRFGRDWLSEEVIRSAAVRAQIVSEIERMPDAFETWLGPRGTGLSGGQKQRIAIARALAGGPSLLILDEPTSALDPRAEALIEGTIASLKGSITLAIIAHRPNAIRECDKVLLLDGGRQVLYGSPGHVLRSRAATVLNSVPSIE